MQKSSEILYTLFTVYMGFEVISLVAYRFKKTFPVYMFRIITFKNKISFCPYAPGQ